MLVDDEFSDLNVEVYGGVEVMYSNCCCGGVLLWTWLLLGIRKSSCGSLFPCLAALH